MNLQLSENIHLILWLAQQEADRQSVQYWGSEHLLASLAKPHTEEDDEAFFEYFVSCLQEIEPFPRSIMDCKRKELRHAQSISSRALLMSGISYSELVTLIDSMNVKQPEFDADTLQERHFRARQRIVNRARWLARDLKHNFADSAHLLISTLQEDSGGAHDLLEALNVDRKLIRKNALAVRRRILKK
ncbi:MAG: hypothetical protein IPM23_09695 [Candidatus Melainabacteria bacterium]|nr:hypothetical protein [Candidatus Melainabacteria bacterium]